MVWAKEKLFPILFAIQNLLLKINMLCSNSIDFSPADIVHVNDLPQVLAAPHNLAATMLHDIHTSCP
jgi:hypothetical protein